MLPPPAGSPGWYADPIEGRGYRYWDGRWWTDHTSAAPSPVAVPQPPRPRVHPGAAPATAGWLPEPKPALLTLPVMVGMGAVIIQYLCLLAGRLVSPEGLQTTSPSVNAAIDVALVLLAYGPAVWFCIWAAKRYSNGSNRRDALGFRFKAADLGWGPLTWACIFAGQIALALLIRATHVPLSSNVPDVPDIPPDKWRFLPLFFLAVVIAPLCEELVFRGAVFRAFRSRLSLWPAAIAQGTLFAVAHAQPGFGWGNIGLLMLLVWVGTALGWAANHFQRIWPGIIAHATINLLAVGVLFLRTYWFQGLGQ